MLSAQQFLKEFNNVESLNESLYEIVSHICEEVKLQGDKALKNYNLQFDQVETEKLELEQSQLKNAYDMLDNETYGTETIKKVDKIVGPGNQYVAYAKKFVFGQVGIDQIAGPTEIALIIDESADLDAIAYDVFAQAEHDEMACTYVISENEKVLNQLNTIIQEQLQYVERQDIISQSIANHHYLILAQDTEEACLIMNTIAPEHASIQTRAPEMYIDKVKYVGALFLGHFSPEVIGDYMAGPSHVLPTNQTARFTNGLSVNDFMTRHSVIHLSQKTFNEVAESAEHIAHIESLFNHEKSIHVRR